MQLCPLEDILVERITHVSRRNNLLWDVNNSNNNHLGHADDSHARRSSQESRQRNVSQGAIIFVDQQLEICSVLRIAYL